MRKCSPRVLLTEETFPEEPFRNTVKKTSLITASSDSAARAERQPLLQ